MAIVTRMDQLTIRLADSIKQAVKDSRVTQAELASALGVSENTIQRRLNAIRPFTVTELAKTLQFLKRLDLLDLLRS